MTAFEGLAWLGGILAGMVALYALAARWLLRGLRDGLDLPRRSTSLRTASGERP